MIKKVLIIFGVIIFLGFLTVIGLDPVGTGSGIVLWVTILVLPWVILYWLIRLVKGIEKK